MKYFILILFLSAMNITPSMGQDALPYYEIPEAPEEYTPETVAARMIDGLGFRYYWATEGLRQEDLDYKPSEEARTSFETLEHLLGLSEVAVSPVKMQPIERGQDEEKLTFEEMRRQTLQNLKDASDILRSGKVKLEDCKIIFKRSETTSEFPFWNNLNGPIADALWHTGQIVSFRRASGNPFNSNASVFSGKLRQ